MPGPWRAANSPWVKEPMEVAADRRVRFCTVMCSAQSAKTQTVINVMCHSVDQDPGPAMYAMANDDDAKEFVRDRARPALSLCAPVWARLTRESRSSFTFTSMPLYFVGAGSKAKLQGKPMKRLYLDEVRNWKPGSLDTVTTRVTAFGELAQIFIISTPGNEKDEMHESFKAGDQRTPHFPCPSCGHMQRLVFDQLKWDTNETTRPNGKYNFDALFATIRYECERCMHTIKDTPSNRKGICKTAKFIRMNPNAPAHRVSFFWNCLLPWWIAWRVPVEEFINARQALRNGDKEPMFKFSTERLAEPWRDELGIVEDFSFLEQRKADYDFGDAWPEEQRRYMAADRQQSGGEHYWYVIRAFGPFGKSRLVSYGRCNSIAELEAIRTTNNVKLGDAVIDSGYKASEVYRFCASAGWKAFKGDDAEYFLHKDENTGKMLRHIWQKSLVDPAFGTKMARRVKPIPLFRWSNPSTKDFLAEYMRGLVGDWSIPSCIARDYMTQVTAEIREEMTDTRGRTKYIWKQIRKGNHLLDCELQILVAAIVTKQIQAPERKAKTS